MSRLLFAAARGARIQRERKFHWENVGIRWGLDDALRIHPDDAHLAYGPISTAARAWAVLQESGAEPEIVLSARALIEAAEPMWFAEIDDELHRSLFLLILAESLADEGL